MAATATDQRAQPVEVAAVVSAVTRICGKGLATERCQPMSSLVGAVPMSVLKTAMAGMAVQRLHRRGSKGISEKPTAGSCKLAHRGPTRPAPLTAPMLGRT